MNEQPPNTQALPAGTRLEEFVIERVLGAGGFGITYLAMDTHLGRKVVIKENLPVQFCFRDPRSLTVSPRHTSGEDLDNFQWSLENFSRESAMLASLDHPGIVKVLRSFQAFGTAYFVMPFVEGMALDELAKKRGEQSFTEEELASLLKETLSALGYLHDRGIYHRDIKPGNILITDQGKPVLIDFGSARQRLSERSMTVVESAGYTPFEQLQSRGNIGPWSDLYALAATMIKVITGESTPKATDRAFDDPWVPLSERSELRQKFSSVFLTGVDCAFRPRCEERWQCAGDWQASLEIGNSRQKTKKIVPPKSSDAEQATDSALIKPFIEVKNKETSIKRIEMLAWILGVLAFIFGVVLDYSAEPSSSEDVTAMKKIYLGNTNEQIWANVGMPIESSDGDILKDLKVVEEREFEIAPGVQMTFCWCPPGEFMMGSLEGEAGCGNDEVQHRVKLTKGFWMGKYEVTQKQWTAILGTNPSHFKGDNLPVETVSWYDAQEFLKKLNAKIGNTDGGQMALPTEAQWEYACRAGEQGPYSGGTIDEVAWHNENSGYRTHSAGLKKANTWGLHDMHGNVGEWCRDWYGEYPEGLLTDPTGAATGTYRVVRGGCCFYRTGLWRAADRINSTPSSADPCYGFRVARISVP
jgi:formylglycine-generating enzyme required for sulfatase activity